MNRKQFLRNGLLGTTALMTPGLVSGVPLKSTGDPYSREVVREFVSAGHNNLDRVKEMLANDPMLVHCRHDLGGGDFEEAIEGAGHVGNKDIANHLIKSGARLNVFALTMLGETNLVKPILERYPSTINAIGPHGFTLLHFAKVGGEKSIELFEYLQSKGLRDTKVKF